MAKQKAHRYLFYYLLVGAKALFGLLPYRAGFRFGGFVGRLAFHLIAKEKKKTMGHLRMAFGDSKSDRELAAIGEKVFENYGYILAELALLEKLLARSDELITVTGREHFDRGVAGGKGIVVIVSHFGNWELLGGFLSVQGYTGSVIGRRIYFEKYDRLLISVRLRMGLETIYRDDSPRKILQALKDNRIVGFVVDQDVEQVDGVFIDFFGRPAFTPSAPVRFAMTTGAPMVPVFIIREGMRHRIIIEPPIELVRTGDKENDVLANTQKWASIQEKYIRQYPHLWVWNHKRWKTLPPNKL